MHALEINDQGVHSGHLDAILPLPNSHELLHYRDTAVLLIKVESIPVTEDVEMKLLDHCASVDDRDTFIELTELRFKVAQRDIDLSRLFGRRSRIVLVGKIVNAVLDPIKCSVEVGLLKHCVNINDLIRG